MREFYEETVIFYCVHFHNFRLTHSASAWYAFVVYRTQRTQYTRATTSTRPKWIQSQLEWMRLVSGWKKNVRSNVENGRRRKKRRQNNNLCAMLSFYDTRERSSPRLMAQQICHVPFIIIMRCDIPVERKRHTDYTRRSPNMVLFCFLFFLLSIFSFFIFLNGVFRLLWKRYVQARPNTSCREWTRMCWLNELFNFVLFRFIRHSCITLRLKALWDMTHDTHAHLTGSKRTMRLECCPSFAMNSLFALPKTKRPFKTALQWVTLVAEVWAKKT